MGSVPANHKSGHNAVENALGATFHIEPKGLFYGLVAQFSRILLVGGFMGSVPANHESGPNV